MKIVPEGLPEISRGREPPDPRPLRVRPGGAVEISPQIPFVVFHFTAMRELQIFLLKALL